MFLKGNKLSMLLSLIFIGIIGCDPGRVLDENIELSTEGWNKTDVKSFDFNINDTTKRYNIYVNVRNSSEYQYRNLYLFIEMTSPSNKFFMDTVEFELADNNGRWNGSGIGNIWQNQIRLISEAKLLETGTYQVKIAHGMRHDTLASIMDIGLRVENVK